MPASLWTEEQKRANEAIAPSGNWSGYDTRGVTVVPDQARLIRDPEDEAEERRFEYLPAFQGIASLKGRYAQVRASCEERTRSNDSFTSEQANAPKARQDPASVQRLQTPIFDNKTGRNDPFVQTSQVDICRWYNSCGCVEGPGCFWINRKDGKELEKHHVCSLWIPLAGANPGDPGRVMDYKRGEVCGGRHPAWQCPHWDRVMYHATLCRNFSQQWRLELDDRGHADDVARYTTWAKRTTRSATEQEAQQMETTYARCNFQGKSGTGATSSSAR
jgi:hypothetical protein